MTHQITAFYQFTPLDDLARTKADFVRLARQHGVLGVVILAPEGINGTVSAPDLGAFELWLSDTFGLAAERMNRSVSAKRPFRHLSVRMREELVPTARKEEIEGIAPATYVAPSEWDALIRRDDVTLIDCRNSYEFEVGTFEGAIDPGTTYFREFADWVDQLDPAEHPNVAMFCTGGIRCEKATPYLLKRGFQNVYHLQGGILGYLAERGHGEHTWQGECFVFDRRVSVDAQLNVGTHAVCWACRMPVLAEHRDSPMYEEGVSCPRCFDALSDEERRAKRERHRQMA